MPDATSVYDAAGLRVAECVNDVWRFLIYDIGGKLVAEYGGVQPADDGGVNYVLTDWQGSTRAVVSNTGNVQSRSDYTAFGEELQSGAGLRTANQGFGSANALRQKYALTERDDATGLDHTWFRKHENQAGRWTSPDPYNGSMSLGDPQSFNRYSYVSNQPTNFVDPSGLQASSGMCYTYAHGKEYRFEDGTVIRVVEGTYTICTGGGGGNVGGTGWELGGGGGAIAQSSDTNCPPGPTICGANKAYRDCVDSAWWEYRKAHAKDGLKVVFGTAIIIAGLRYAVTEIRHASSSGVIGSALGVHGAGSTQVATLPSGGALLGSVFFSGRNEAATLKQRIAGCKKRWKSADHSYEGAGIIF